MSDMKGKTVVVTGGNSGIGFETAAALASMGARVLVTARNADKGRGAVSAITQRLGGEAQVQLVVFDLADLASVRQGAAEILEQVPRLDVLVNNAGVVLTERAETVDGYEATLATNHLGPFLLTNLLLDRIKGSAPARIVTVASGPQRGPPRDALRRSPVREALPGHAGVRRSRSWPTSCSPWSWPGASRAARAREFAPSGHGAHRVWGRRGHERVLALGIKIAGPFFLSPATGARTSVYLASSPDVEGISGQYFVKCKPKQPGHWAQDPEAARRLWQVSEELVGLAPAGAV